MVYIIVIEAFAYHNKSEPPHEVDGAKLIVSVRSGRNLELL